MILRSDLATRLVFGPILLGLVATIYWLDHRAGSSGWTGGLLAVLALAGVYEYWAMMRGAASRAAAQPVAGGVLAGTVLGLVGVGAASAWAIGPEIDPLWTLAVALQVALFATGLRALAEREMSSACAMLGGTLFGFVWIGVGCFSGQLLAQIHLASVLMVVLVCKFGDIGGYLVGRAFGRHKLIPHVSGGKTIEGSLGSLLTSIALAMWLLDPDWLGPPGTEIHWLGRVAIGVLLNLTTQVGDLIESVIKRACGVKDSSSLLPAHGGVLDLIDSLLFSFPAYCLFLLLWG